MGTLEGLTRGMKILPSPILLISYALKFAVLKEVYPILGHGFVGSPFLLHLFLLSIKP